MDGVGVSLSLSLLILVSFANDAFAAPKTKPKPKAPPTVVPAPNPREEEAREAVRRGFAAFARGDAQAALDEYQTAQTLVPEANLPYRYAAEALVMLGRTPEAIASLDKYLSLKPDVSDATVVRARIDELRATLPSILTLDCAVPTIAVRVDGGTATAYQCPAELKLPGGEHVLAVHADGKKDAVLKLTSSPEASVHLTVEFEDAAPPTPPSSSSSSSPPDTTRPDKSPSRPLRTLGFVSIGTGVVALGTALVVDLALLGPAISEFKEQGQRGDPEASKTRTHVQTYRTIGIVSYASAAGFGMLGGVLIVVSPKSSSTSVRARIAPFQNGGVLDATLDF